MEMKQERKTFENFTKEIKNQLESMLGKKYSIELSEQKRRNGIVKTGVTIIDKSAKLNISPIIYLEEYWKDYKKEVTIDIICDEILQIYAQKKNEIHINVDVIRDLNLATPRIFREVINAERNKEYIKDKPHYFVKDLAVVFRIYISVTDKNIGSILVTKEMMEEWNISTEELIHICEKNEKREFPTFIVDIEKLLFNRYFGREDEEDEEDEITDGKMFVAKNKIGIHGARAILQNEVLERFARIKGDFYIIPSSIHELIFLPVYTRRNIEELKEMVREINQSQVQIDEQLSDNVYYFDSKLMKIR